ncbi:hypothetical protein [Porphyrobacter sp. LM 6]|uniref:hypothetical protein n=1 Tax=Porphyrobacter sp. LM 6 TaxID=1896196 RepID=UPI000863B0E7|nr:hypothetical protein [Porphyrobacter sp. LM 6]AOL94544.1 hypothetical protein BG023_111617 [Porphyrobacter sp. LM 6]
MTTKGKIATLLLGATVFVAAPLAPASADDGDDIVVSSTSAMDKWQQATTARLDRAMRRGDPLRTDTGNSIVQITFTRGPDGKPANPQFYNGEGSWIERRIAKQAVMSLDNLDEVPVKRAGEVRFIANLIFAEDYRSLNKLRGRLLTMESARVAAKDERSTYIALGY